MAQTLLTIHYLTFKFSKKKTTLNITINVDLHRYTDQHQTCSSPALKKNPA